MLAGMIFIHNLLGSFGLNQVDINEVRRGTDGSLRGAWWLQRGSLMLSVNC